MNRNQQIRESKHKNEKDFSGMGGLSRMELSNMNFKNANQGTTGPNNNGMGGLSKIEVSRYNKNSNGKSQPYGVRGVPKMEQYGNSDKKRSDNQGISQAGRSFQEAPGRSNMGGLSRIQISGQSTFQNKKNGREGLSKIRVIQPKLSLSESNSQGTSPYSQASKTLRSMNSSGMNYSNDQFKQAEIKYPSGNRKIQSEIKPKRKEEFKSTSNMKMYGMHNNLERIDEESFTSLRHIKEHTAKRRLTEGNISL